ncbi:uncharacterized protein LOC116338779, partial [Contarinia nasturtii]|uniref:uncharacterized protein LOC116338779 n=1 Tax=Contarinia nasturtii TaxID=265458 RepID=UPI0012D3D885
MASQEIFRKYSWLNSNLFERALNQDGLTNKIIRFAILPAFDNGDNYSSCLIRANVEYSNDTGTHCKQFIIKASLGEQLVRSHDVFAKEICIYDEIVPKMESVLMAASIPMKLTPRCYSSDRQQSYLILEDLTLSNYKNVARTQGLNFDQLKQCINALALWHAASVKINTNDTSQRLYDLFQKPHVHLNGSPHYKTLFENAVYSCSQAFENRSDLLDIVRKLSQLIEKVFEKCCTAVERNHSTINVLNHGDLWSMNIMFNMDSNIDALPLFLDFQTCYFGSPILDLSYLVFSSSNDTVTSTEYDQLFDYYFEQLIDAMIKLKLPSTIIPTKEQLQHEFELRGCFGAFFSLFIVPLRSMDDAGDNDVKQFLNKSEDGLAFRKRIYSNPKAQKLLTNLL